MLGGTFDPPHLAHLALAAAAMHHLQLDRVLLVPAGDPWRKSERGDLTPAPARLRLTRAAAEGLPWLAVSDVEIGRDGPTYTAETLELLTREGGDWWFILGEDALADMPRWHEPARIATLARLAVARRPGRETSYGLVTEDLSRAIPDVASRIDVVPLVPLTVSSTELRRRVREGRSTEFLLPEAVARIVEELGLYR